VEPCQFIALLPISAATTGVMAVRPISIEDELTPTPLPQPSVMDPKAIEPPSGSSDRNIPIGIHQ
jgi:hypothetical protein